MQSELTVVESHLLLLITSCLVSPRCCDSSSIHQNNYGVVQVQWCGSSVIQKEGRPALLDLNEPKTVPGSLGIEEEPFNVTFTKGSIECRSGVSSSIPVNFDGTVHSSSNGTMPDTTHLSLQMSKTGYLNVDDHFYPPQGYCVQEWTSEYVRFEVCGEWTEIVREGGWEWRLPDCGGSLLCLPKCCPMHSFHRNDNSGLKKCAEPPNGSMSLMKPLFYDSAYSESKGLGVPIYYHENFNLEARKPTNPFLHENHPLNWTSESRLCFRIMSDGALLHRNLQYEWEIIPREFYCLDIFQDSEGSFDSVEYRYGIRITNEDRVPAIDPVNTLHHLSSVVLLVSSAFFGMTLTVHLLVWNKHEEMLRGRMAVCHSATMTALYLLRGSMYFARLIEKFPTPTQRETVCVLVGIGGHFLYLSSICWTVAVCLNVLFSFISPFKKISCEVQLLVHIAIGWGLPLLFVAGSVLLDYMDGYVPCSIVVTPEYGLTSCFVSSVAVMRFVFIPTAILLSIAIALLGSSFALLRVMSSGREDAIRNSRYLSVEAGDCGRERLFWHSVRLCLILGLAWSFEFLVSSVGDPTADYYHIASLVVNSVQALAFFLIHVTERHTLEALRANYPQIRPFLSFRIQDELPPLRTNTKVVEERIGAADDQEEQSSRRPSPAQRRPSDESTLTASTALELSPPPSTAHEFFGGNTRVVHPSSSSYVEWADETVF